MTKDTARRIDECMNCRELGEMAAHGLCYACYRKAGRAKERAERQVDRHNPAIRREHKKLFRAQANIMAGLSDLGMTREDVMEVKVLLQPYLLPIQEYLDHVNSEQVTNEFTNTVNGEQQNSEFTVHSRELVHKGSVNGEHDDSSSQFTQVNGELKTQSSQVTPDPVPDDAPVNGEHQVSDVHVHFGEGEMVRYTNRKTGCVHTGMILRFVDNNTVLVKAPRGRPAKMKVSEIEAVKQ